MRHLGIITAIALAAGIAGAGAAQASVISATPSLPLLDTSYVPTSGAGCFDLASVCVTPGTLTLTSLVSSNFTVLGQDIVTDANFTAALTSLSNVPLGTVQLTGTAEQEVIGRANATETGTWTTELIALSLTGTVLGSPLVVSLDPSDTSSGTTSIVPVGNGTFQINSFFDVFVDITLDTTTPLSTTRGPIQVTAVPEPASLALLALPLLGLAAVRRRPS